MRRFAFLLFVASLAAPHLDCRAQETRATLRTQGNVLVNGNAALPFSAILSGTRIETQKDAAAVLEVTGSHIEIAAETIVEFEGDELRLEQGGLSVLTFHSMMVKIGCILAVPVHYEETLYTITDKTGHVTVVAIRNDVNIKNTSRRPKTTVVESKRSDEVTVRQGEQKSREEKCGGADLPPNTHAAPAALGAILNSRIAQGVAAGGVGVICYFICGGSDDPASPAKP